MWKAEPHQVKVLQSPARFKTIIWHRKARKTTLAINELLRWAAVKVGVYWLVSPYATQARRNVWDDPRMLPAYLPQGWKTNANEMTVRAPNGSIVYFLGADNPEGLRGPNPYGVIFDEFDDIGMQVWDAIVRPVLTVNGGWAWFMGTPKGEGNLYRFFNKRQSEWAGFLMRASESHLIPEEELSKASEEMPQDIYRQEFECAFISGGTNVFRGVDEVVYERQLAIPRTHSFKLGVDLAKLNDWTVITPLDLHTLYVHFPYRFNQIDYPMVEARIEAEFLRYNRAQIVEVDSTGVGEPVCDHLVEKKIPVVRRTFTEDSRAQMLAHLAIMIEQRRIRLPPCENLLSELKSMRYEYAGAGSRRLKAVSGTSDDCVMSLALAVNGIKDPMPESTKRSEIDWDEILHVRSLQKGLTGQRVIDMI